MDSLEDKYPEVGRAIRAGRCPECDISLREKDPYAHSLMHYRPHLPMYREYEKARFIQRALQDYKAPARDTVYVE